MVFDAAEFVSDVRSAAASSDSIKAVQEVVAAVIVDRAAIDSALGTELKPEQETLLSSEQLTVQRIIWPLGLVSSPHEHRMWAVVGVYAGEELNRLYERGPEGLRERDTRTVPEGDVFFLDADRDPLGAESRPQLDRGTSCVWRRHCEHRAKRVGSGRPRGPRRRECRGATGDVPDDPRA